MTEDASGTEALARLVSPARLAPYLDECEGDFGRALRLYEWNARMSSTAFETIAHLEVALRNAMDAALARHFGEVERGIPWFLRREAANETMRVSVEAVRERLGDRESRDQIVANLNFGFWSGLVGSTHEELWRSTLHAAFVGGDGRRKQVSGLIEDVRKLRNRLAHHDSTLKLNVPFEMERVFRVAGLIDPDLEVWLRRADRSLDTYAERPENAIDTVIVAAREAWPYYVQHRAYVCQPGRYFRDVQRMAFYAERAVQADVPWILERRDDVVWTAAEAQRLSDSENGEDRKIGRLIAADGETAGGRRQVFLLSRPGDARHRVLGNPLVHQTGARGSAFVQRQRYVSLHALETARTTRELVVH